MFQKCLLSSIKRRSKHTLFQNSRYFLSSDSNKDELINDRPKKSPVYTRTGDKGTTSVSLFNYYYY
jgi:hypothetical protein